MKKLGLFVAGTMLVAGGTLVAVACSDTNTNPLPTPGRDTGTDAGPGDKDGSPVGDGGGGDGGNCTARLRPSATGGPFCPFVPQDAGDGGRRGVNCPTGDTCCNGQPKPGPDAGFDDSVCVTGDSTQCPVPTDPARAVSAFECTENDDCVPAGQKCCIPGFPADGGAPRKPGVGKDNFTCNIILGEFGTRCKAACDDATELQGCQADGDCSGGKKCNVVKVGPNDGIQMGICQ